MLIFGRLNFWRKWVDGGQQLRRMSGAYPYTLVQDSSQTLQRAISAGKYDLAVIGGPHVLVRVFISSAPWGRDSSLSLGGSWKFVEFFPFLQIRITAEPNTLTILLETLFHVRHFFHLTETSSYVSLFIITWFIHYILSQRIIVCLLFDSKFCALSISATISIYKICWF